MASQRSGSLSPRLLVVMRPGALHNLVAFVLDQGRYERRSVPSVDEANLALQRWRPHFVIVDLELEGAITLIGRGRDGDRLPVIALAHRGDFQSKLAAYERGVDDLLTIPLAPEELVVRSVGLMRRVYDIAVVFTPALHAGELWFDLLDREVRIGTRVLRLTTLELALLYLLAANQGSVLSREVILDALWGDESTTESNVVDQHVRNLRLALGDDWRQPRYIATVASGGYRFLAAT